MASPATGIGWHDIRQTLTLGAPLAMLFLLQIAINTTDVVMVAWLGADALAAGGLGTSLFFVSFIFSVGPMMAVSPLVAQARGAKQPRAMRRYVRQGFWVGAAIGTPLVIAMMRAEPILLALGQAPQAAAAAAEYLSYRAVGLVPMLWFVCIRSFLSAYGRPNGVIGVLIGGIFANAFLNWALIFGNLGLPALGLIGAGIASTLVNTLMFILAASYVARARGLKRLAIFGRFWRSDWQKFREVLALGLPIGITRLLEAGSFSTALFLMGILSQDELAAHNIAVQYAGIAFMIPLGLSQAGSVRVGFAIGARDWAGIDRAANAVVAVALVYLLTSMAILIAAPGFWVTRFLDPADPANTVVIAHAITFVTVAGMFQLFDGMQAIGSGILAGMKDTRGPMVVAGVGFWLIGIPTAATLAFRFDLGGIGIWFGVAFGLATVATMHLLRVRWQLGRYRDQASSEGASSPISASI